MQLYEILTYYNFRKQYLQPLEQGKWHNQASESTSRFKGCKSKPYTLIHTIHVWYIYLHLVDFSRKRPRRVPSKKALSLKTVFKDCHQTSPKVLLKWWLSLKIVIKHRPKFYWSDGCLIKHRPKFYWSDGCQTSPKVLLKWWLSLRIVIKHRPKFYWSDGCL